MNDPCKIYRSQHQKASEVLDKLLIEKTEINNKLNAKPYSASLNKALREINMDIRITENEIEHAEFCIRRCESELNTLI